jgi:hypothetical protein
MDILKGLAILALVVGVASCAVEGPVPPPPPGPYLYDYFFYPSVGVYFNIRSGYYYFRSDGRWVRSNSLPPRIRLDHRDRHRIETREPEPYRRNPQYQQRFKPIPHYQPSRNHDHQEREFNRQSHKQFHDKDQGRDDHRKDRYHH